MISAILVDDEIITVEALKKIIESSNLDINIIGTAIDGLDAMKIIKEKRPDFALVDIRMPCMDGLALIKTAKELGLKTRFLILSAYRDFEYARQAIEYGAYGYLVKPIDEIKLLEIIKQVKEKVQEDKNLVTLQDIVNESIPLVKDRFLRQLLNENTKNKSITEFDIDFLEINEQNCQLMVILFGDFSFINGQVTLGTDIEKRAINYTENLLRKKTKGVAFFFKQNELILLFNTREGLDTSETALELMNYFQNLLPMDMNIGISTSGYSLYNIRSAYNEARIALLYKFYYDSNSIIFFNQIKDIHFTNTLIITKNEDYLIDQIKMGISGDAVRIINQVRENMIQTMSINPEMVYNEYYKFLLLLNKGLENSTISKESKLLLSHLELEDLKHYQTLNQLSNFIIQIVLKITSLIENSQKSETFRLIEKVKLFCEENYSKDITLDLISSHVCMSKNYFCSFFKEKTGISFWDYITQLRICKSKVILETTEMKIGNISEIVGYKNSSHFCRIFKEIVGVSPSVYKQKFLEKM